MNPFRKLKALSSPSAPQSRNQSTSSFPLTSASAFTTHQNLTIVELFQSQSCSSCPPANNHFRNLLPSHPNTLLLTYEVTYWNHLSWVDTFSDSRWDARQRDYVRAMGLRAPFTPQVVIDGGRKVTDGWWGVGEVLKDCEENQSVRLRLFDSEGGKVVEVESVGHEDTRKGKEALVQLICYEAETEPVKVLRGENRGVTIRHRNVVRDLVVLGKWESGVGRFEVPGGREGLEMVVLVQRGVGGQILGALRV